MKIYHIFILILEIENPFCEFDIHQQIFFAKFHENPTLPERVYSIFESADPLPVKLNQLPPAWQGQIFMKCCKDVLLVYIFKFTLQILQGKLEPLTLNSSMFMLCCPWINFVFHMRYISSLRITFFK